MYMSNARKNTMVENSKDLRKLLCTEFLVFRPRVCKWMIIHRKAEDLHKKIFFAQNYPGYVYLKETRIFYAFIKQ